MPIVRSRYRAPLLFRNGHLATVYSGLFRSVNGVQQDRERITLSDGDFLDLDWSYSKGGSDKVIILLHGLEGNAQRPYMLGAARYFNAQAYDVVCMNFRGCGGEPNKFYHSYHSGATEDLGTVIQHVRELDKYSFIGLNGFSLGGNVVLKYLGEKSESSNINAAVAVSVPCNLSGSCKALHQFENILYHNRFKRYLVKKLKEKQVMHPDRISQDEIRSIKTLRDFDNVYTAKAHGFRDADDYYSQSSSKQFLNGIRTPVLILNALNDSFLSAGCFPVEEAKQNSRLLLEMPRYGGHVAFYQAGEYYYNEVLSVDFFKESDS
ncbi:MAG: alpha/beta fold hydrolase [Flavobacteriaceae bacterium]|nr:alpha/beta fold hydrolase [Bacteroidia bacterium]NNK86651.1 alpha/beta fold hydrolase [Flavobacteriaceae bacterium]